MITINPVKFNTVKPISFTKEKRNVQNSQAILTLQSDAAKVNFEKELNKSSNADSVQHPIKSLGYKIAKAFNILFAPRDKHEDYIPFTLSSW